MRIKTLLRTIYLSLFCFSLLGCLTYSPDEVPLETQFDNDLLREARMSTAQYAGVWALNLKVKKETCNLGIKGQTIPTTAVITQTGKKIVLTLPDLPAYKGRVKKKGLLVAKGTYNQSGLKVKGNMKLKQKKKNPNQARIKKSALNIVKGLPSKCKITYTGSATKS